MTISSIFLSKVALRLDMIISDKISCAAREGEVGGGPVTCLSKDLKGKTNKWNFLS